MQDRGEVCLQGPMSSPYAGHGGGNVGFQQHLLQSSGFSRKAKGQLGAQCQCVVLSLQAKRSLNLSLYMQVLTVHILSLPEDFLSQREAVVHTNFL